MARPPQTVLVTGASRGLGLEFVRQLSARGDRVIAACRTPGAAPDLRAVTGRVAALDVTDQLSIASFVADLGGEPIDVLINNAGISAPDGRLGTLSFDHFRRVLDTNVFGAAVLTQALLANLSKGRRRVVLNITSTLGSIAAGMAGFSYAYSASKAALNKISALMAHELRPQGLTVVAMCPGWNRTDMGGPGAPLDPRDSIARMVTMMDGFTLADSGTFRREDGAVVPW